MSRTPRRPGLLALVAAVFCFLVAADSSRAAGVKDHPLIKPYTGSTLTRRDDAGFREYKVVVGLDPKGKGDDEIIKTRLVSGELARLYYENPKDKSPGEIFANYKEGLVAAGFKVIFECLDAACGPSYASSRWTRVTGMTFVSSRMGYLSARRENAGAETYAAVSIAQNGHEIDVLERRAMETGLVTVTAAALDRGLAAEGKAVLDGILFDTDKATIRPESKAALDVIGKFLNDRPNLKVFIVGHTDTVGSLEYNLNLSKQRAQAVTDALVKTYGIAASRLSAHGVGPLSPAATNRTDPGKGKNRRVEMVER